MIQILESVGEDMTITEDMYCVKINPQNVIAVSCNHTCPTYKPSFDVNRTLKFLLDTALKFLLDTTHVKKIKVAESISPYPIWVAFAPIMVKVTLDSTSMPAVIFQQKQLTKLSQFTLLRISHTNSTTYYIFSH